MENSPSGKRSLVTGGTSGIGLAIAGALGDAGARVCVNHRGGADGAQEAMATLQAHGVACMQHEADVSDPAAVARMFEKLDSAWGGIESVWSDPAGLKDLLTKIPLGWMGEVDDIARMAVVLVSDVASYVTGTTIFVDGGMTDYPDFSHGG